MAIGATDYIDQLLVDKYATEKVDNHDTTKSAVDPEKMMSAIQNQSTMTKYMFNLNNQLSSACAAVNAICVHYNSYQAA